jgi:hypothetical protein
VLKALPELLTAQQETALLHGAFEAGMSYLENISDKDALQSEIQFGEKTYKIQNDDKGFTVTTQGADSDEDTESFSLRFGDPELPEDQG